MVTTHPVDRFLRDAERASRQGRRRDALDLLVLALDIAPGDPAVLIRAHAVRDTLPPPAPATDGDAPSLTDLTVVFDAIPESVLAPVSTEAFWESDEDSMSSDLRRTPPSVGARRWRGTCAFLAALGCVVLTALHPGAREATMGWVGGWGDPVARAEIAFDQGRHAEVLRIVGAVERSRGVGAQLQILRGRALLETGDTSAARRAITRITDMEGTWGLSIEAAQLILPHDVSVAGDLFLDSFERGAPADRLPEVVEGLRASGRDRTADHVADMARRLERDASPALDGDEPLGPPGAADSARSEGASGAPGL